MNLMRKTAVASGWTWGLLIALDFNLVHAQPPPPPPPGHESAERDRMESRVFPHSRPEDGERRRFRRGRPPRFDHQPDRAPHDSGPDRELTPEQIERLMKFMQENFSEVHERMAKAREENPILFKKILRRTARIAFPILRVAGHDPELAEKMIAEQKAQMTLEHLGRQYRAASDPREREDLKTRIREQTIVRFETRLQRLRDEIQNLQRRLDEARQDLADQEKNKETLIDEKVNDFMTDLERPDKHHRGDERGPKSR